METADVSFNRGVGKAEVVHIDNEILLSHKRDEILPLETTWMGFQDIMLSEVSQKKLRAI